MDLRDIYILVTINKLDLIALLILRSVLQINEHLKQQDKKTYNKRQFTFEGR